MGLTGSPPVFQSLMEKFLVGLTWKSTIPYLDDCIIFFRTAEEHVARLREVFQRCKDANLKINPLKCEFFRQHVPFWGHIVSRDGIQADLAKTSAVRQYPAPKSVTEVRSFLGLCSYYWRYVRDFAAIARPLHQLTEKTKEFHWNPEAHKAFEQLKDCLTSTPILALPRRTSHSSYILMQVNLPSAPSLPKYRMASNESFATPPNLSTKLKVVTRKPSENF